MALFRGDPLDPGGIGVAPLPPLPLLAPSVAVDRLWVEPVWTRGTGETLTEVVLPAKELGTIPKRLNSCRAFSRSNRSWRTS